MCDTWYLVKEVCYWREAAIHVNHDPEKHSMREKLTPTLACRGFFILIDR